MVVASIRILPLLAETRMTSWWIPFAFMNSTYSGGKGSGTRVLQDGQQPIASHCNAC